MKILHGLQQSLRIYGCGRFNLKYLGSLLYRNVIVFFLSIKLEVIYILSKLLIILILSVNEYIYIL